MKKLASKRLFDLFFSSACLLIGAPLFGVIAAAILLTSRGKVIYSHERVGRNGRLFRCYKFRSMYADADRRLSDLLKENPSLQQEWNASYKLKNDPRITAIGRFLRKTSLDELPQFWNVLKGDLSIVGPRPVLKEEIGKYYQGKAEKILSVRPGLTGVWQVSGRSDVSSYSERVAMDEYYIDNQSFLFDLKLIAKTVPAILFSKGAY